MIQPYSSRPVMLLRIFQVFALLGAIPFLINTADILLYPFAASLDHSMGRRIFSGLLVAPLTVAIAILCIRRAPRNVIGWLLLQLGFGTSAFSVRLGLLPLPATLTVGNWFIGGFWMAFLLIPLYFPDGRLFPPEINRWGNRLIAFLIPFLIILSSIFNPTLTWGSNGPDPLSTPNPLFIIDWDYTRLTMPITILLLIGGVLTVILRYRRGTELERLQLRWLLFGVLVQLAITTIVLNLPDDIQQTFSWTNVLYTLIIPTAIGMAILRYRLYDIDIIIRRTVVYGFLTLILGLAFFGSVFLFQQIFRAVTGDESAPAIVISTLVIYVLFNPLRSRIQSIMDQRFFRKKYNAEQVIEGFTANVRQQVDLETLGETLKNAVRETIQPQSVSLWVRSRDD